jgi:preprotein translocase subunit SecD
MNRTVSWTIIGLVLALAIIVNVPSKIRILGFDWHIRQGLDLQGGVQVLLEADVPASQEITSQSMDVAASVISNRVNALGVSEAVVQVSLPRRIVVELPGYDKPEEAVSLIQNTALLEFVETQYRLDPNQKIETDYLVGSESTTPTGVEPSAAGSITPSLTATPSATETPFTPTLLPSGTPGLSALLGTPEAGGTPVPGTVYHTLMTGAMLKAASAGTDAANQPSVNFSLTPEGAAIFSEYTTNHVGWYLAIVLDKNILSCPRVNEPIPGGSGQITGSFTVSEANQLAIWLSYGALPIPLKIMRQQSIGPTLGQDSLRRSLIAGLIGLLAVVLFMLLYYRLPGALADLALLMYALTSLTVYRMIPVTFSLPGIAGFILSVGMAVDANILIFERMKEELRAGKILREAVDAGFARAWTSIRDSNISTLITCGILLWFGSTFGASIIKGFAITLAAGVLVSMFTAIVVTRSLLHLVLDRIDFSTRHSWFGIADETQNSTESAE